MFTFLFLCRNNGLKQWGSGGSRKFWWGGIWSTKPQKFGCLHQNWEWFFGRNRKFKRFFRPNSGGLQKKKKKKKGLHQNWDWFFAGLVTFRSVGGDASRNGAELFETEADFSAKIVTFRLVGGMHPSIPPPKSATALGLTNSQVLRWRRSWASWPSPWRKGKLLSFLILFIGHTFCKFFD